MTDLRQRALDYHAQAPAGKLAIETTKPTKTLEDLALAYSPGVAHPCLEIQKNPKDSYRYTARGNLVGVISNGTAVLGLGNIGAAASKPVMEGKGVLFKRFAGVDVFDLEVDETDPKRFIDIVSALAPTFGGINLEDIKAPECFEIEETLKARLDIPVFHDDQHGTAIVAAAALQNALLIAGKSLDNVRLVCSGAGAAAVSCLKLLIDQGLNADNVFVFDSKGLITKDRGALEPSKAHFAKDVSLSLDEAMHGADVFLGLSRAGILTQAMLSAMADTPIVFALANPNPEIDPHLAHATRNDVIMATGRSDYPNQVNNALCFPYIFRGALDTHASQINETMKRAVCDALAALGCDDSGKPLGKNALIPTPLDARLLPALASACAKAAMDSGVARHDIEDLDAYRAHLSDN